MPKLDDLPIITLKWAQTLDGQLADDHHQSQWISGPEERRYTHEVRSRNNAVLVGAQTFLKDRCQLTVRAVAFHGTQPARVIMDPRGRVFQAIQENPDWIQLLSQGPRRTYIMTDVLSDHDGYEEIKENLQAAGVAVVTYRYEDLKKWLVNSLIQLGRLYELNEETELKNLMVEGGAGTLAAFLKSDLADQIEVAISPLILGGTNHRVATGNLLKNASRFEVQSQEQLGVDILLRYKINHAIPQREVI